MKLILNLSVVALGLLVLSTAIGVVYTIYLLIGGVPTAVLVVATGLIMWSMH